LQIQKWGKHTVELCSSVINALTYILPKFFLPRDASAERGNATVSRLSVTFRYQQHIG